jgi:MFS transporter, DHA1 family, multidrug resistance protein
MPDSRPAPSPPRPSLPPLWLLASITLSGTLAMHIFVPALPFAAQDLNAGASAMQLTLSAYIAGLALGQLVYAPISDRFGRRAILIIGMIIFAAAGLAAMVAPTVETLVAARLFQALGGCTGLVLGRAIVRDTASGVEAARNLSLMNLMVMVGPGLSPLLGSALAATAGWRSIFAALSLLGVLNLLLTLRLLRETSGGPAHGMGAVLPEYVRLARSPRFIGYAIGGGCATTSIFAFIGAAPFIFVHQLDRPVHEVGIYLALIITGAWFGTLAASRAVGRFPMHRLLVIANLLSCTAAATLLLFVLSGHLSVTLAVLSMIVFTFGAGMSSPLALTAALSVNPRIAGSASGLYGFGQMGVGAVCTAVVGIGANPALAASTVLLATGILAQLSFWIAGARSAK